MVIIYFEYSQITTGYLFPFVINHAFKNGIKLHVWSPLGKVYRVWSDKVVFSILEIMNARRHWYVFLYNYLRLIPAVALKIFSKSLPRIRLLIWMSF